MHAKFSKNKYGSFRLRINMTPQARRRRLSTCEKRKALTFWLLGVVLSPYSFLRYLCSDLFTLLLLDLMMTTSSIYLAIKCKCIAYWRVGQITTIQYAHSQMENIPKRGKPNIKLVVEISISYSYGDKMKHSRKLHF